jgi:hypothetical protein
MKKYNNDSPKFADWTTKKLKQEAIGLDEEMKFCSYGTREIMELDELLNELDQRGIEIQRKLSFK